MRGLARAGSIGGREDGLAAVELAARERPDVVLMDIRMPKLDGLEATRRIVAAAGGATRVLVLTTFDLDHYVYEALAGGAGGFLLKDAEPEKLVEGIRVVAAGDALFAPSIMRQLIESFVSRRPPSAPPDGALAELTPREREILGLIARGMSNAEIAQQLYLTEATVKTHVGAVYSKLDLRDRAQAVVFAYECCLVQTGASPGGQVRAGPGG